MTEQEDQVLEGTLAGRIEAILFVAGDAVRVEDLAKALNIGMAELERQGICYSVPGSGRYVSKEAPEILRLRTLGQIGEIETLCRSVFAAGATLEEVHAAVDRAFEKGGSL